MAGSSQNNSQLVISIDLRFMVLYGGDFVEVDDKWKWKGNETTSLLVPSNITKEELVERLKEKLCICSSTQIELKFKVPNWSVPPMTIKDNNDLDFYIQFHKENELYVSLCKTEVPNGLHTDRNTTAEDNPDNLLLDTEQIPLEPQHQWLRAAGIYDILRNYKKFICSPRPPNRPSSGSRFLFNRTKVQNFREDGHNWRKKKDGKTVNGTNEKLKVGGEDKLRCYYDHGEEDKNFKRRIYWMLEEGLSHIVLVHYLEAKENRTNFNRVRESEVIPDSQKPRENIRNSEVDSSVFSESRTYNYEGTLQVTDSSNHNIAHASEFKNAESVHCQQQSPGFQPCDNVSQPMVKKMRGGSIPYYDVPISDDCQGQCLDITVQNVESNTRRGKNKNVMVQSWENVVYSNTDGFQTTNFQPLFSSAQSSTGMMLGHENELLEHVVSGAIGTRQEFGSHSNFWLHGNSRHDPYSKIHDVNNEELYDTMGPCNTYPSNQNKHTMRSDHRKQDGLDGLPREGLKMLGNFDRWESEFGDVTGSRRCSETIDIEGGSDSFISAQVPLDNNILDRSPYRDPHYSHFMPRNFLSSQYDLSGYSFENEDVDVEPQIVQIRGPGRANPVSGLPLPPAPCPPPPPPPPPPARCCAPRPRAPCCPRRPRAPCCPPRAPCCPPPPRAPCCPPRAPCPDAYPCSGFQRSNFPAEMMSDSPLFHCEFPQKTGSEPMRTLAILFIFLVGLKICFGFLFM
ncbi:calmodulin-binding transcription activator 3-like isoform X2 [Olea europaea var. sylvestris]|uniref:calmodulin-binding transcription activator 3-like isoform X2 n=1 Tax=Olea europaea var. sylvestris TaxID=158386 RepID=UPI000C1D1812|nr:calmodulin-binding transcription activator 3-like isoform X2 [Olea europaea var. sylvestris]